MLENKGVKESAIVGCETQVTISKEEYERLIRDSEKLAILETLARTANVLFDCNTVLTICGSVKKVNT